MNRKLRVDFSNDGGEDEGAIQYAPPAQNGFAPSGALTQTNGSLPPLPQGIDLPPGLTCPDSISRTLGTLPPAQLLDVLSQMKNLVSADAGKATELLRQAPQLSYAIFQALLLMGLVSTEALSSVVEAASAPPAAVPVPPVVQAPIPIAHGYPPPIPGQGFTSAYPPPPHIAVQMGTPQPGMPYPPPPPSQYRPQSQTPAQAPPPPPQLPAGTDTEALIKQVLEMPQEIIDQLPPAEKAQIMALRQQFLGGR